MLPRSHRLKRHQVNQVKDQGLLFKHRFLNIKFIHHPAPFKAAVIISKKNLPLSVQRNHLKRRIYQSIKQTLPPNTNAFLVVFATTNTPKLTITQIQSVLEKFVTIVNTTPKHPPSPHQLKPSKP